MSEAAPRAPLFSVILPTHNRAATLARAIRSVLDQTLKDLELIVVDDGSTDGTAELLRHYAGQESIRVITSQKRGAAAARNLGAREARGAYLAFQDSDDEWMPRKLELASAALRESGPETAGVYGDMIQILPDGQRVAFKAPAVVQGRLIADATEDFQVLRIGIQTAVIKRECFEATGGFDEALPRYIDMEFFARLALRYQFKHLQVPLALYYLGPGISQNRAALVAARRYLLNKYSDRLQAPPRLLAWQYLHLAEALSKNGEKLRSAVWVLKALARAPSDIGAKRAARALLGRWRRVMKRA
jgi:glycosyltransferase involved in cell wall biosynthesis